MQFANGFGTLQCKSQIALAKCIAQHLYFLRKRTKVEVDFIVYGPKGSWAIEVKRSSQFSPKDVKPLNTFMEEYPKAIATILT